MRRKFDDYKSDVVFDVWMRGGNVDLIDDYKVRDCYDSYYDQEETTDVILKDQREEKEGG